MPRRYNDPDEAFAARTKRSNAGPVFGGVRCLEWTGGKNNMGYGQISVRKKMKLSHRYAFAKAHGEIPDGVNVLHRCDNPLCCEPRHLFLGSQADNVADMVSKGRGAAGEAAHAAKLTAHAARSIRERYVSGGCTQEELAAEHGVTIGAVNAVLKRRAWKGAGGPGLPSVLNAVRASRKAHARVGASNGLAKLSAGVVVVIRARAARGEPQGRIARDLGVSQATVSRVVTRALWGHVGQP